MFLDTHDLLDDEKKNTVQQLIDTMPISIGVKDASSQYLIGNNFLSELAGFSNSQDLKRRYDNDFNCLAKHIAHLFVAEDALVMKQNRAITLLVCAVYANNKSVLLYGKKYPILDKSGVPVATGFCVQDVINSQFINLIPLLSLRNTAHGHRRLGDQFSYIIAESIAEYQLSPRQLECLFHLLRGQSANGIASALNMSKRTVETHIDVIKYKLGCDTKAQLVEKAISTGLLNYVPSSVIKTLL